MLIVKVPVTGVEYVEHSAVCHIADGVIVTLRIGDDLLRQIPLAAVVKEPKPPAMMDASRKPEASDE